MDMLTLYIYHEGEVLRLSPGDYAAIGLNQVPRVAMIMMIYEIISATATKISRLG